MISQMSLILLLIISSVVGKKCQEDFCFTDKGLANLDSISGVGKTAESCVRQLRSAGRGSRQKRTQDGSRTL